MKWLQMLYLVCKMLLKVNYFVDNGKNVICGVFIKAEMILFWWMSCRNGCAELKVLHKLVLLLNPFLLIEFSVHLNSELTPLPYCFCSLVIIVIVYITIYLFHWNCWPAKFSPLTHELKGTFYLRDLYIELICMYFFLSSFSCNSSSSS